MVNLTPAHKELFFLQAVHNITTEGVNVDAMFARETLLDVNRLFCNNVHDMAKYYGIEAANKTIVREIKDVFQVCGGFFLGDFHGYFKLCRCTYFHLDTSRKMTKTLSWVFWLKPLQRVFDLDPK